MTDYAIDVEPKTQFLAIGPDAPQNAGMISPAQCRAARGFLNWTQADLAREAQVGKNTLIDFEQAKRPTRPATIIALEKSLHRRRHPLRDGRRGPRVGGRESDNRVGRHGRASGVPPWT